MKHCIYCVRQHRHVLYEALKVKKQCEERQSQTKILHITVSFSVFRPCFATRTTDQETISVFLLYLDRTFHQLIYILHRICIGNYQACQNIQTNLGSRMLLHNIHRNLKSQRKIETFSQITVGIQTKKTHMTKAPPTKPPTKNPKLLNSDKKPTFLFFTILNIFIRTNFHHNIMCIEKVEILFKERYY